MSKKDKESIFLSDLEQIDVVDPVKTKLIADTSPSFRKSKLPETISNF